MVQFLRIYVRSATENTTDIIVISSYLNALLQLLHYTCVNVYIPLKTKTVCALHRLHTTYYNNIIRNRMCEENYKCYLIHC